jgi:hypothetical protein
LVQQQAQEEANEWLQSWFHVPYLAFFFAATFGYFVSHFSYIYIMSLLFMQDAILSLFDYRKKIYELSFGVVLLIVLADCVRLLPENFLHLA